jgi:polysaccharide export outer membrane protein
MRTFIAALFVVVLALAAAGCGSSNASRDSATQILRSGARPIQAEAKSDDYVIRAADSIKVDVWGYPEFNAQTVVKEVGTVTIPNLGEVTAVGLTKDQFRQSVVAGLSEIIQGEVKLSLVVTSAIPQKITVIGAVTRQENFPLSKEVTLVEALAIAGGITVESDLTTVTILRGGLNSQPIMVDMTYYFEHGNFDAVPIVRPGDTIFVPRVDNVIREISLYMRDVLFLFGFFQLFN